MMTDQSLGVGETDDIVEPRGHPNRRRALFADGLRQYHYLGYGGSVGENLQYLIGTEPERPLVLLLFGAAAWKCQERDRFIGWPQESRQRHLGLVANNSRFLILPWVKVPHLGSWALGQVSRRLSEDWQGKYGHCIALVETFVEAGRFVGAGITFLVGAGVRHFHTVGIPVALTSIAFAVGLALIPFAEETKGMRLPT